MNETNLKSLIIDTLKSCGKKRLRRRELYGIVRKQDKGLGYDTFKQILTDMEKSGEIERMKGRRFGFPDKDGLITGIFTGLRNGGGVIRTTDGDSVFVRHPYIGDALSGDKVQAKKLKTRRYGLTQGAKITSIVERRIKPIVGIFRKMKKTAYVIPREDGFNRSLIVKEGEENGAKDGDLVIAGIESQPTGFTLPLCKITEVLGDPDAPGVDVLAIALRYSLPIHFPEEVIRESEQLGDNLSIEIHGNRKDLRGLVTFTIDPVDAKDFDDAISLMRTGDGGYELGVHIADVSYYVSDRTAMDREAEARGMSCYLVDRVLPMLPERVSNDLCSLKPHVDRLTKSVLIQLDAKGTVLSHEIANTVIHSKSRLTYEQVQEFLNGNNKNGDVVIPTEVCEVLITFSELTDLLIKQRTGRGALDFELPEARVLLDDSGKPVNILKNRRFKAHRMVEEAMLLANTITAVTLREHHVPFLYRIHDKPDEAKLAAFGEIASELGYDFRASRAGDDGYIQSFIISISGKKHEQLLNTLLLRSMKKAAYSPINIGHYGLGLSTYAHFTSPIRRYPDLIVHRQLDTYIIHNGKNTGKKDEEYYKNLGNYITEREIITDNAERESTKMKTAEFMKGHLGEEYDGTISGILPLGFFVELDEFYVEGLVHVSSLEDDYYEIERSGIAMSGRNRGRRFVVGERVRILVARADKDRGEVDFFLVEKGKKKAKKSRK